MEDEKKQPETGAAEEPEAEEAKAESAEAEAPQQDEQPAEDAKPEKESRKDKKEKKALEKELSDLKAKLDEEKDQKLRLAAEYDNYRKRTAREKEASFGNGVTTAVTQLLPVVDTLEMALAAPCEDANFKKGIEMTLSKCAEALKKLNVTEMECLGKPFDAALQDAVMQQAATDEYPSGTVARVLLKGYLLNGKVVRHATVVVSE